MIIWSYFLSALRSAVSEHCQECKAATLDCVSVGASVGVGSQILTRSISPAPADLRQELVPECGDRKLVDTTLHHSTSPVQPTQYIAVTLQTTTSGSQSLEEIKCTDFNNHQLFQYKYWILMALYGRNCRGNDWIINDGWVSEAHLCNDYIQYISEQVISRR